MPRKLLIFSLALITLTLTLISCGKDKVTEVEVPVFLLFRDIHGNAEFESDGNYPPPDNLDNAWDDNIVVTLRFGEDMDIFEEDEVYGYIITADNGPGTDDNFWFKYIPDGYYWLEAELVIQDSCFYDQTDNFYQTDSVDTVIDLFPAFIGTDMGCFDLILTSASEEDCVQLDEKTWVTKKVYERFYREREGVTIETP
jgi:hypothetical protein